MLKLTDQQIARIFFWGFLGSLFLLEFWTFIDKRVAPLTVGMAAAFLIYIAVVFFGWDWNES